MTGQFSAAAERSYQHLLKAGSYAGFDIGIVGRPMIACMDPRFPQEWPYGTTGRYAVSVQTAGGEAGMTLDTWAAFSVSQRSLHRAQSKTHNNFPNLLASHQRCALAGGLVAVVNEVVNPSNFTRDRVDRMAAKLVPKMSPTALSGAQGGFARLQAMLEPHANLEEVVSRAGHYSNGLTYGVEGENEAGVYVTNYHTGRGLNRNVMPADVQGYHDGIGAYLEQLGDTKIPQDERVLLGAAALWRSAAASFVVTGGHPENARFIDVDRANNEFGIVVQPAIL